MTRQLRNSPAPRIGPYLLREQIGEGGMGLVFRAEQAQPVRRQVAVKVIKPGMANRQMNTRFEAERQALAMMDHTNIARVIDGGTTENGRPYFVMELVHGVPITKYCDDNQLTLRERLELFIPVCLAVQHAHQKGIIHRDIKPSNVLITLYEGKPVPKVIDFGVAKAMDQKLTDETFVTNFGTMVGTLEYMSPEQAAVNKQGIDTRSDIYSLGVLLYELLTGSTPLTHKRLKDATNLEILQMIKEEEPQKPSTRLSDSGDALASISAMRKTEPAKLTKLLRGELDWIVMKTLEKDRNRRYETAIELAVELQRYLSDEPVQACPPSARYRVWKFAKRNRILLLASAAVLFVILPAVAGSVGWALADRAERRQDAERRIDVGLAEVENLYERGKWSAAREVIGGIEPLLAGGGVSSEHAERVRTWRIDLEMVDRLAEIQLLRTASRRGSFDYEIADSEYARTFRGYGIDVEVLDQEQVATVIRSSRVRIELAAALDVWATVRRKVRQQDGEIWWKKLLEAARGADPDATRVRVRDALLRRDLATLRDLAGSASPTGLPAATLLALGVALREQGDPEKAVSVLRRLQQWHPEDFWANVELGESMRLLKPPRLNEALAFYTAAAAISPQSPGARNNVGRALGELGLLEESQTWFQDAIRLDPENSMAYFNLGYSFTLLKKPAEAEAHYREAIRYKPGNGDAHNNLGGTLKVLGRPAEAEKCFREAIRCQPENGDVHNNLGNTLLDLRRPDDAEKCFREAIRLKPILADAHSGLALALAQRGRVAEAEASFRETIRLFPANAEAHFNLGTALQSLGKFAEAAAAHRQSVRLNPDNSSAHNSLGVALWQLGKSDEAVACYREAIRLKPDNANAQLNLGGVLDILGKSAEGEHHLREAVRLRPNYPEAHNYLGYSLARQGKFDDAKSCYREAIRLKPDHVLAHINLCNALSKLGDWSGAVAACEKAIQHLPQQPAPYNQFAWLLATCPDPKVRNPGRAVELARRAVALAPKNGGYWNTLGVALYRNGEWKESVKALGKSMELGKGGDGNDFIFLAMAHHQLGEKDEARNWYKKAVVWMQNNAAKGQELSRFRTEAEAVLGISDAETKKPDM